MAFVKKSSSDFRYMAATDILIGDMSSINYMFILMDKPIVLLANEWLRDTFPEIGIMTDVRGLERALDRCINDPQEYEEERRYWASKAFYESDGKSCQRVLDTIISRSGILEPRIEFIHGNSAIHKTYLDPLCDEAKKRNIEITYVGRPTLNYDDCKICVAAYNWDLQNAKAFNAHVEHGSKANGTGNWDLGYWQWKYQMKHFPFVHLHIAEGELGYERLKTLLGPLSDRVALAGSTVTDRILELNTVETKKKVCAELRFDENVPLITYAPAGKESFEKPGGSLSPDVLGELKKISKRHDLNILVKVKYNVLRSKLSRIMRVIFE